MQLELPRNLRCAACGGGGCDACGRAGALSLRARKEPAELVEVTLPSRATVDENPERAIVLRIPERGGLPEVGTDHTRGNLLVTLTMAERPDPCVTLVRAAKWSNPASWIPPQNARLPVLLLVVALILAVFVWYAAR